MAYNLNALKFLVVDDNRNMRGLLRHILSAYGIQSVFEAEDGAEGYQLFKKQKTDVIIVDWMMDKVNGIDFTRMVRTAADSPNQFVPIIMLTGYTEMAQVIEARDCGVTEFISKPVSARCLYDRIARMIESPRSFVKVGSYLGPDRRRKVSDFTGEDKRQGSANAEPPSNVKNSEQKPANTKEKELDEGAKEAMRDVRDRVGSLLHENQ